MKNLKFVLIVFSLSLILFSCEKEKEDNLVKPKEKFVSTDVLVGIKRGYEIEKVFDFINSFDHKVEEVHHLTYTSALPSDSLQYVLNYLNAKPYINNGNTESLYGYLQNKTKVITIFPRLFDIKNPTYQEDWLKSVKILKLKKDTSNKSTGGTIYFHVPRGKEKEWEKKFKEYECVEWAELNYYRYIKLWN